MPSIEIYRRTVGYEVALVEVDQETMDKIARKKLTREELNGLFATSSSVISEILENNYPHSVYNVTSNDHPILYSYEDLPE